MKSHLLSGPQRRLLRNLKAGRAAKEGFMNNATYMQVLRACRSHGLIGHSGGFTATFYLTDRGLESLKSGRFIRKENRVKAITTQEVHV